MRNKMRRLHKRIGVLFCAVFLLLSTGLTASAAEPCQVYIQAEIAVNGHDAPQDVVYTLTLTGRDEAPMPETTEFSRTGAGKVSFGPITYTIPGDYVYTLTQKKGEMQNMTYDASVIEVTVRVTNDEENGGLKAVIWGIRDGKGEKLSDLKFTNTYEAPASPGGSSGGGSSSSTTATVAPQTGDMANAVIWCVALAGALILMVILLAIQFRRKKDQEM